MSGAGSMASVRRHGSWRTAAVALAAALALQGWSPAAAQTAARPAQAQQPWQVNCSSAGANEPLRCQMSQTLVSQNTGQRVLAAVIVRKPDENSFSITFGLPHGLYLPDGVQVWVDDGERLANQITTADQNGSYSQLDISASLLEAMRRGALLNVAVTSATRDEVILQLSLAGFSASIDKL